MIQRWYLSPDQGDEFYTTTEIKNFLELHTRDKININKLGSRLRKLGYDRFKKGGSYGYNITQKPQVTAGYLPINNIRF